MTHALLEAARERVTARAVLYWFVFLVVLWTILDPSPAQFATTLLSMGLFGLLELTEDVYDLRQSVRNAGFGLYALAGGTALAAFDEGPLWLPVAFVLVGAWFVFDAVQTLRHEGATEDQPTGREVYHDYVARQVRDAVDDGPLTRRELSAELAADDEAVDAAVEKLVSRGVLVREGSAVRLSDPDRRGITDRLADVGRRIARPLTLELDGSDGRDGSGVGFSAPSGERAAARSGGGPGDSEVGRNDVDGSDGDGNDADGSDGGRTERERGREPTR